VPAYGGRPGKQVVGRVSVRWTVRQRAVIRWTSVVCLCVCRAPVLVALALIELGMKYEDAVELIRE